MYKPSVQSHRGFTLMEVMVSVSIFAIVVTIGIAALLTINKNYRKSQSDRQAIDNLTYVLESMSRRIRTAGAWDTSIVYGGGATSVFSVKDQDGILVTYELDPNTNIIKMTTDDGQGTIDLTPEDSQVSTLTFVPFKGAGGTGQPYVQINVQGVVNNGKQQANFQFQTSVSKRTFE